MQMNSLPDNDFSRPPEGQDWLRTANTSAAVLALCVISAFVVPSFAAMLHDIGDDFQLPALTHAVISMSSAAWIALGTSACAVLVIKNFLIRRSVCAFLDVATLVGCVISVFVIIVALFLPLSGGIIRSR